MDADLTRVYDTLSFIEEHYHRQLSVKELERVSHYSYRNIQRIFKYTCGETIGAYQQRLKVEHAYKMILYTSETLSSIALETGFANPASFSKAFKQHFGVTPGKARKEKRPLLARAEIIPLVSEERLKPDIVYRPPTRIYYESAFIQYNYEDIETLWNSFIAKPFPAYGTQFYGIIADEPLIRENLDCRYDACSSTPPEQGTLPSKLIPGGRYACFTHPGSYETIEETYKKIYAGWILETGLELATTPIIEHYIRHPDNTLAIEDQQTAIWLPLR